MKLSVVAVALAALVPFSAATTKYCCLKANPDLLCNCRLTNLMNTSAHRAELCDYTKKAKTCASSKTANYCCSSVADADWEGTEPRYNANGCVKAVAC
ncbi:hypothetical protein NA57DRAFT_71170 [Rhizodiscina lignyota]|uniref:Uncharacterized protein n=1 Tax=Rhizodiscina lignyota TaxID=1504668 RepID=A0A9P4ISD0_9PEZI|nr:hypothetical protein NA57DRAFT_71170 [Rhizodiscina lignyota]